MTIKFIPLIDTIISEGNKVVNSFINLNKNKVQEDEIEYKSILVIKLFIHNCT